MSALRTASAHRSRAALEVVPSQILSALHRAGLSFVPQRLVLSVFGTWCSLFFSGFAPPLLLFFQRVVIMRFCFITFAMRKVSFSSALAVPAFRFIIGKPFLTRCCSGLTHTAASTAELIC
jgi:hypothetical protein